MNDNNQEQFDVYINYIKEHLLKESSLYIIFGTDLGIFPTILEAFPLPDGSRYLFLEPDEIFPIAIQNLKHSDNSNVFIAPFTGWQEVASQLKLENYLHTDKVVLLKSLSAVNDQQNSYANMIEQIKDSVAHLDQELKAQTTQKIYHENILLNAVDNINPAQLLANQASGTALVIGAGPSLDHLLPWIKNHQHKFIVIIASRLYQQLSAEGIKPDIVVSIDPQPINYEQSKPILIDQDIIFVHSNHVSPKLPAHWDGVSFYMGKLFSWETKNNLENIDTANPTVSHAAVNLAIEMGFDQILLSGVDLCFDASGRTHAEKQTNTVEESLLSSTQTYKGEVATTNPQLRLGIRMLGELIQNYDRKIFNLSNSAAKVSGIEFNSEPDLEETKCKLPNYDKPDTKKRKNHLNLVQKELSNARLKYSEIRKLCNEAIRLNEKSMVAKDDNTYVSTQVKIDKIEQKLNTKYRLQLPFLQQISSEELVKLLKQSDRIQKSPEENYQWLNEYYQSYNRGTKQIIEMIDNSMLTVKTRMREFADNTTSSQLISLWKEQGTPGRACFAKTRSRQDDDSSKLLTFYCDRFNESIQLNTETGFIFTKIAGRGFDAPPDEKIIFELKRLTDSTNNTPEYFNLFIDFMIDHLDKNQENVIDLLKRLSSHYSPESKYFITSIDNGFFKAVAKAACEIDILSGLDFCIETRSKISESAYEPVVKNAMLENLDDILSDGFPHYFEIKLTPYISDCYHQGQKDTLQLILNKIESLYLDEERLSGIKNYLKGLILHLESRKDGAICHYRLCINILLRLGYEKNSLKHPVLEAALKQMTTLSENHELLITYLILSKISETYKSELSSEIKSLKGLNQSYTISENESIEDLAKYYRNSFQKRQIKALHNPRSTGLHT